MVFSRIMKVKVVNSMLLVRKVPSREIGELMVFGDRRWLPC